MREFIRGQMHPNVPLLLSETGARIQSLTSQLFQHYAFRGSLQLLDEVLISSFIAALAEIGIEIEAEVRRLQHFASSAGHSVLGADMVLGVDHGRHSYHRVFQPTSRFVFVGTKGVAVRLSLTCRVQSDVPDTASVRISVNKEVQGDIPPTTRLTSWDVMIGAECVRDGINEVQMDWPFPTAVRAESDRHAVLGLSENRLPELRPVFAEIHELQAWRAS
jgi:hypothetical protein